MPKALIFERVARDTVSSEPTGWKIPVILAGSPVSTPPRTTAIGALAYYASHADPAHYEPSNITFGIMEPIVGKAKGRAARKAATAERALADLAAWADARTTTHRTTLSASPGVPRA